MQPTFDAVFRVWGCTGFDPQVAGIVRVPAKFEWHEMVVLNVFQRSVYPYAAAFSRFSISVMEAGGRIDLV